MHRRRSIPYIKSLERAYKRVDRKGDKLVVFDDKITCAPEFSIRGNIWHFDSRNMLTGHPASFPVALAHDHIMSWSNEDDTVLDPFMGSGTSGVAAVNLGRNFIGIEIAQEYFDLAKKRIDNPEQEHRIKSPSYVSPDYESVDW